MLRKIKKALPAIVSAVLCVAMAMGITASAASVWSDAKALTNAKYNSNYIKWVEKYSKKESKSKVTFSKSRTKKFLDKQIKVTKSDDPQTGVSIISKDVLLSVVYKGDNMKMVIYSNDMGLAFYSNPEEMTMLSIADKKKTTVPVTDEMEYDEVIGEMNQSFMDFDSDDYYADLGISENAKGKIFKFKSGGKTYYYEEFKSADYEKFGFLFNEKGTPLAIVGDELIACFTISNKVKDSEFTVPDGYKETDINDMYSSLVNLL